MFSTYFFVAIFMDNERNKIVYCIVYLISSQYRYIDKVSSSLSLSSTTLFQTLLANDSIETKILNPERKAGTKNYVQS